MPQKQSKFSYTVLLLLVLILVIAGCSQGIGQKKLPVPKSMSQEVKDICLAKGKLVCHGDCLDGFGAECYFDSKTYQKENLRSGFSFPEETKKACTGIHSGSVCGKCFNRFELRKNSILEEVSCEEFFQAIEDKNKECSNCLDTLLSGF